jgi:hypothetical protein
MTSCKFAFPTQYSHSNPIHSHYDHLLFPNLLSIFLHYHCTLTLWPPVTSHSYSSIHTLTLTIHTNTKTSSYFPFPCQYSHSNTRHTLRPPVTHKLLSLFLHQHYTLTMTTCYFPPTAIILTLTLHTLTKMTCYFRLFCQYSYTNTTHSHFTHLSVSPH